MSTHFPTKWDFLLLLNPLRATARLARNPRSWVQRVSFVSLAAKDVQLTPSLMLNTLFCWTSGKRRSDFGSEPPPWAFSSSVGLNALRDYFKTHYTGVASTAEVYWKPLRYMTKTKNGHGSAEKGRFTNKTLRVKQSPFPLQAWTNMNHITFPFEGALKKIWLSFFCLTSRFGQLEVVHSLDTSSSVMVIERFIARRGTPCFFCSDNRNHIVCIMYQEFKPNGSNRLCAYR